MWGSLFFGGLLTSIYAETQKVLLALLLALPAALIFAGANLLWALVIGPTDFLGFSGFVTVFGSTLVLGAILCGLGGAFGFAITHNKPMEPTRDS